MCRYWLSTRGYGCSRDDATWPTARPATAAAGVVSATAAPRRIPTPTAGVLSPAPTAAVGRLSRPGAVLPATAAVPADSRHQLVGGHLTDLRRHRRRPDQRGLRHRRAEPGQTGSGWPRHGHRGP